MRWAAKKWSTPTQIRTVQSCSSKCLTPDGWSEVIETTDNHPFYVEGNGWTRVDALQLGDAIPSSEGRELKVVGLTWTNRIETVYNFGVEGFHTYFVGESGAWVHNCLTSSLGKMSKELERSVSDIRKAIHKVKGEEKIGGSRRNPDTLVDTKTGDVFIKDEKTGGKAAHIGNVWDHLK